MNNKEYRAGLESFRDKWGITIGHDVEVFLKDQEGRSISAIDKVGGTKESPMATEHGWVQEDGVAAELNIRPASNLSQFRDGTLLVMDDLLEIVKPLDLSLQILASTTFSEDQLLDTRALVAGCEEDYDAYAIDVNMPPQYTSAMRSAGGHIHIGWRDGGSNLDELLAVVKAADFNIVLPSLLLDGDNRRRSLYGKAGAHRPKSYGVEVRSPSNFWLRSTEMIEWVYYQAIRSVEMANSLPISDIDLQSIINGSDIKSARSLIEEFSIAMPEGYTT